MTTVLVVDDSAVDRALVGELLGHKPQWEVREAEDGVDALARIGDAAPDVVVTDLQMPRMDGLELVAAIRTQYPSVPVILMTAFGSEALAVEALEKGAAAYVPKTHLAEKLVNTMEKALSVTRADRDYEQLIHCLTGMELSLSLPSEARLIDPLVSLVQQMIGGVWSYDSAGCVQIGMALREALLNALFHGSLEIDPKQMQDVLDKLRRGEEASVVQDPRQSPTVRDRKILVHVKIDADQARFVVRDEGPGFDIAALPSPRDPAALGADRGRGLPLMGAFMDEIRYNEVGNEVTMVKRRSPSAK